MFRLLVKTKPWIDEFAKKELKKYVKRDFKIISEGFYEFEVNKSKDVFDIAYTLTYYSRTIESIYLKITEFEEIKNITLSKKDFSIINKNLTFEIDALEDFAYNKLESEKVVGKLVLDNNKHLEVNLNKPEISFKLFTVENKSYLALDLIGFKLTKRDYKLNINSSSINSLVVNFCFYLLELEKIEKDFSVLDPATNLGDVIIEVALFNPKKALNIKKRHNLSILRIFDFPVELPKYQIDKNTYIGVVQNNKIFKQLKENANFSSQKIKISQYNLDWLDVKFKKNEIDFIISNFPSFKKKNEFNDFQKEFFYQAQFVARKYIGIISKKEINEIIVKKYKLRIIKKRKVYVGEQKYHVYIFK